MSEAYCMDCMEYMKTLPDNAFDLAVVDPPYGDAKSNGGVNIGNASAEGSTNTGCNQKMVNRGGVAWQAEIPPRFTTSGRTSGSRTGHGVSRTGGGWAKKLDSTKKIIAWDTAPGEDYFQELFRVSRNQIIWGGNYFDLPPTRCFLIWEKTNIPESFTMAMAEYAWTSFNDNAKIFRFSSGGIKGRFHPTQKPISLYDWILSKYAKPGDRILDTHLGSGSSRISAWKAGLDFVGTEIDEEYFKMEEQRFAEYTAQQSLFFGDSD